MTKRFTSPVFLITLLVLAGLGFSYAAMNQPDTDVPMSINLPPAHTQVAAITGSGSGLVGYWNLDEAAGTVANDTSGNGNNGKLVSGPTWTTGRINGALTFNGTNQVSVPNPSSGILDPGSGSFTFSVWVYPTSIPTHAAPIYKGGTGSATGGYAMNVKYWNGGIGDGTKSATVSFGPSGAILNAWSMLTVVLNRADNTVKTYLNGAYTGNSADATGMGPISNTSPLQIGMGNNWLPFYGDVDDVRIYNRALSASEVSDLFVFGGGAPLDTKAPAISSVASSAVTSYGAVIAWTTDEQSDSQVEYGTSISYGSVSPIDSTMTSAHSVTLSGLSGSTLYHYRVKSKDATGNVGVSPDQTFTTGVTQSNVTAASCSQSDVQNAITAVAPGGTVTIPAGTCTWGDNGSYLSVNKAITLQGSGRGSTVIDISPTVGSYTNGMIRITAAATVKSFTIRRGVTGSGNGGAAFVGSANGFRVSDIEYTPLNSVGGYFAYANAYGLIDSNDISGCCGNDELIFARGPSDSWQTGNSLGGPNNLFIEDNIFKGSGYVDDCNSNTRCVVRFNTVTGPMKIDSHGKVTNSPPRGVRESEVYGNTWTAPDGFWTAMELRGGTGRVFNNSIPDATPSLILNEYYVIYGTYTAADYPIDDQIGVGMDPKVAASEPMYLWNNRRAGSIWPISLGHGNASILTGVINPDRDYYNEVPSFNGSSGVGVGTYAQMMAITPTRARVGFWVTDQGNWNTLTSGADGQLYVWNGSSWVLNYVPYQYPHPMRTGTVIVPPVIPATDTTPPAISSVSSSGITSSGATITWSTNEAADSQVEYGFTTSYGNSTALSSSMVTAHSLSLSSLNSNTVYHYRVKSKDAAGNPAVSGDMTLTTQTAVVTPTTYTLTVTKSGTGSGTVSSSVGGISCGTSCTSTALNSGTAVTLTATPASGSTFGGWSGACSGTSTCSITLSSNTSVGATFTLNTVTPPSDTMSPSVNILAPLSGSAVSGTGVQVSASASDNVGVAGVQFKLDGANLGTEALTAPYAISWNTTSALNGTHTLTATARDSAGNTSVSSPVSVTVANVTPVVTNKFIIGDRVHTTSNLKVRSTANGTLLGTQKKGSYGTVTAGPVTSGNYVWWNVNFDAGVDGWSAQNWLTK
jgi:hypothetical protein